MIHVFSRSMVSELIVSANDSTEPSCELAASSSQNSLPGGSFMEVNSDMKKALKEATLVVYQDEIRNSLFTSFLRMYL